MQTTHLTDKVIPLFSTPVFVEVGKDMPDVIPNIKDLEYHNYSNRHKSGIALRFPRFNRIRWDKPIEDVCILDDIKKLIN